MTEQQAYILDLKQRNIISNKKPTHFEKNILNNINLLEFENIRNKVKTKLINDWKNINSQNYLCEQINQEKYIK